jgi:hypothetical protein
VFSLEILVESPRIKACHPDICHLNSQYDNDASGPIVLIHDPLKSCGCITRLKVFRGMICKSDLIVEGRPKGGKKAHFAHMGSDLETCS